jgi:hypothetical protein
VAVKTADKIPAILVTERVKPILDALYPQWSEENPEAHTTNSRIIATRALV